MYSHMGILHLLDEMMVLYERYMYYDYYINPILTYAGSARAPHMSKSNWNRIEVVQTSDLRLITNLR